MVVKDAQASPRAAVIHDEEVILVRPVLEPEVARRFTDPAHRAGLARQVNDADDVVPRPQTRLHRMRPSDSVAAGRPPGEAVLMIVAWVGPEIGPVPIFRIGYVVTVRERHTSAQALGSARASGRECWESV